MEKKFYFFNGEISQYGIDNGYVDLEAFAANFSHISINQKLFNSLECKRINELIDDYFESDGEEYTLIDRLYICFCQITMLEEEKSEYEKMLQSGSSEMSIEDIKSHISELEDQISNLKDTDTSEEYEDESKPVSFYIVDEDGVDFLAIYTNEPIYYSPEYNIYIQGVTKAGENWTRVLTDIKIARS